MLLPAPCSGSIQGRLATTQACAGSPAQISNGREDWFREEASPSALWLSLLVLSLHKERVETRGREILQSVLMI